MKVPWLPKIRIADRASRLINEYEAAAGYAVKPPIPVEDIIEQHLRLRLSFDDLNKILGTNNVLGATYVGARLICINERLFEDGSEGRLVFTCAHEVGHWLLHRKYVDVKERRGSMPEAIICRTEQAKEPIEWQADYFASCLLMPEEEVKDAFTRAFGRDYLEIFNEKSSYRGSPLIFDPSVENWHFMAGAVCETGGFSNVSKHAMIIRLQELGLLVNLTGVRMVWK